MISSIEAPILNAIISATVTTVSWFALHFLSRRREDRTRHQELALRYLQRQIEELYGPLVGLIQQSRIVNEVASKTLPHTPEGLIDIHKFSPSDTPIWEYFLEKHFLPLNSEITNLLRTKLYLLESGMMPDSFQEFLSHSAYLECLYRVSKEKDIDLISIRGTGWPITFETEAKKILSELVWRYNQLIRKWANHKKRAFSWIRQQDGKRSLSDEKRPNNSARASRFFM